ncbi:transcriptional regulator, TetR family [Collimonas sp. OK307]|uniref:TetR/AcrR family transcriptional regulator n=1 Tax=Collimonas sp. OK307 TaxID=1801620 RepID=UPI0008E594E9|nr:TetR/AcrR family transcriptional regulator [Collimonas sp. OK307]SFI42592.1 transcriptional regulator, TetR family [Collimonas sp. OK307]
MVKRKSTEPAAFAPEAAVAPRAAAKRPGRPAGSVRGPEQRNRLLDTALVLFARQGIADTTLASIAREAKVTPAMVNYYFTSRDQLIDVLVEERFLPVKAALGGVFQAHPSDPVAAITELTRRFVDITTTYPWFAPLWLRGIITHDGLIKQRMHERVGDEDQKAALQCIKRWQREGLLNSDLEPALIFMSLMGVTILPLAAIMTRQIGPAGRPVDAGAIARHAISLLVHGVGPH